MSLRLTDMTDLSVIHAISDNLDADGFITAAVLYPVLDVQLREASSRLSWMARIGVLERVQDGPRPRYRLSEVGQDLHDSGSPKHVKAMEALAAKLGGKGREVILLDSLLGMQTDPATARVLRRTFRYHDGRQR